MHDIVERERDDYRIHAARLSSDTGGVKTVPPVIMGKSMSRGTNCGHAYSGTSIAEETSGRVCHTVTDATAAKEEDSRAVRETR